MKVSILSKLENSLFSWVLPLNQYFSWGCVSDAEQHMGHWLPQPLQWPLLHPPLGARGLQKFRGVWKTAPCISLILSFIENSCGGEVQDDSTEGMGLRGTTGRPFQAIPSWETLCQIPQRASRDQFRLWTSGYLKLSKKPHPQLLCCHPFSGDNGNALFSREVVKINAVFKCGRENRKAERVLLVHGGQEEE